ncbi:hypothetical protein MXE00_16030, partial [Legionella pneumophila]
NVGRNAISFAFNLGQFYALFAVQGGFDCGPLQVKRYASTLKRHLGLGTQAADCATFLNA